MTVTLIPEQLAGANDLDTEPELVEPDDKKADLHELAVLLAQAYVATPLFP